LAKAGIKRFTDSQRYSQYVLNKKQMPFKIYAQELDENNSVKDAVHLLSSYPKD